MAGIVEIKGGGVGDSRGRPTVEAEVIVGRGATPLASGRAIAPAGASTGAGEAKALDVPTAVKNINTLIPDAFRALSVAHQQAIDERLIELDGPPHKHPLRPHPPGPGSPPRPPAPPPSPQAPLLKHPPP